MPKQFGVISFKSSLILPRTHIVLNFTKSTVPHLFKYFSPQITQSYKYFLKFYQLHLTQNRYIQKHRCSYSLCLLVHSPFLIRLIFRTKKPGIPSLQRNTRLDIVTLSRRLLKGNSIIYFYDSGLTGAVPEPYQNKVKINFYYIASTSFFQFYIFSPFL